MSPNPRRISLIAALVFTALTIVLKTIFALALALLLNEGVRRFVHLYRVLIYLPAVLPTLIVALIFRSMAQSIGSAQSVAPIGMRFIALTTSSSR